MPDFGQYSVKEVERRLRPRKGKGLTCRKCGKVLDGRQRIYFGGICGKCLDEITKRR